MTKEVFNKIAEFQEVSKSVNASLGADYVGISRAEYKVVTRLYSRKARKDKEKAIKDFKTDLLWYGASLGIVPADVEKILNDFEFNGYFVAEFIQINKALKENEFKVADMVTDKWGKFIGLMRSFENSPTVNLYRNNRFY